MQEQSDIKMRLASAGDYSRIAEIYNIHINIGKSSMEESLKAATDIKAWVDKFHDRERLYVCEKNGLVIGWGIIKRYSDREGYRFACETAVYLISEETGKGYGGQIKQFLIGVCKELDYHHLVAKIFADNEASIRYNQKLGYEIVGRQKQIGWKNDRWQDIVIMQLILNNNKS